MSHSVRGRYHLNFKLHDLAICHRPTLADSGPNCHKPIHADSGPILLAAGFAAAAGGLGWWLRGPKKDDSFLHSPCTPFEGMIHYHHMYVGEDGLTHMAKNCRFGSLEKKGFAGTPQYVRAFCAHDFSVKQFVVTQQFGKNPWHYCPCPQFVITLAGSWYIITGDGETHVMGPGSVLFQDNHKGHPLAIIDGEEGMSPEDPKTKQAKHYSGCCPGGPCNQMVIQIEFDSEVNNPARWSAK